MKTPLLLLLIFTMSHGWAMKKVAAGAEANNPVTGAWKYSSQSAQNDFQLVLNMHVQNYSTEYFVFEANNKFRHEFINNNGVIVKSLTGKWKTIGDKIKIDYSGIHYSINVGYFFLDKDLVLGQNFNHVIFTKDNVSNVIPIELAINSTDMNIK